jgi:hypothetical protein
MRLNKDEFRIAFGVSAEQCGARGCNGVISYRVDWKTEDGSIRSERKRVNYVAKRWSTAHHTRNRYSTLGGRSISGGKFARLSRK